MFISLLLLACVVFGVAWRWGWRKTKLNLPPLYPGAWPILGHNHIILGYGANDTRSIWRMVQDFSETVTKGGGVLRITVGFSDYIMITDPEDMITASNACLDKPFCYGFAKCWLGDGLLTGNAATWKRHRKLLNPSFSQQIIESFIGIFNSHARILVREFKSEVGKGYFHHFEYLDHLALEAICQTAIGIDAEDNTKLDKKAFVNAEQTMLNIIALRVLNVWLHSDLSYWFTSLKKKQDETIKVINNTYNAVIDIKKLDANKEKKITGTRIKSFMDLLLDSATVGSLTDKEVWEEVNTIIVAGHDTVATCLAVLLIILGSFHEVQEKVLQELIDVFGDSTGDVTKNDLHRLVYMDAVIKEALRVYPLGVAMLRYATVDVKLKKYTISAGTDCILLMYGLHRHPVWGEDADKFRPDRWLEKEDDKTNAFAGFGIGKRNCIGRTYAMMFLKTTLSHLLRRYRITADISKVQFKVDVMMKPASGDVISIEERTF